MNIKSFLSSLFLSLLVSLFISAPVFALGISPAKLIVDPAVPGQKRIVELSVSRRDGFNRIELLPKIDGAIAPYIKIVNPERLIMEVGATGITIPLEVDVTGQAIGKEFTGTIRFSEKNAVAKEGIPANFSDAIATVNIVVSASDAPLISINSLMTSWNVKDSQIDLRFTQYNGRNGNGSIEKVKFTLWPVDDVNSKEFFEIPVGGANLAPKEDREENLYLPIDKMHLGSYEYTMDFIDEQGRIARTIKEGMLFHSDIIHRKIVNQRITIVALVAMLIAAIFAIDYFYLKRKFKK